MHFKHVPPSAMRPHRDVGRLGSKVSARPHDGDLMITRESGPTTRYTIQQLPDIGQISAAWRDDAVRLARGVARARAVNVWYSDGVTLRLLDANRPPLTPEAQTNAPDNLK